MYYKEGDRTSSTTHRMYESKPKIALPKLSTPAIKSPKGKEEKQMVQRIAKEFDKFRSDFENYEEPRDGESVEGHFKDGSFVPEQRKMFVLADGSSYKGNMKGGKFQGEGILKMASGIILKA